MGKIKDMLSDERKRFLLIVCVCTALFWGFKFIGPKGTITHWIKAKAEIRRQEKQMEQYRREIEAMDKDINELKNNKDSLEKFAREQFHFAAPDEDVYLIKD
ncbi:MAG: septum formation initiator family protein [Bacteroidales bacterium]|nr:septum formation initiator family protein [Bacteroidales bacterium]